MVHPIPPLPSLRAFEATGRLLSFRKAAEELSVTRSAVSHQIHALEEGLGVRLLERSTRGVALTPAGQAFLPEIQAALDRLATAIADLRRPSPDAPLTISLLPTFAVRWLIPRLGAFRHTHPDIEVRLDASLEVAKFAGSDVDLAIRYGRGDWPGLHSERLIAESLILVCSPTLLQGPIPLEVPSDLAHHVLLHNSAHPEDWSLWLRAAAVTGIDLDRGPSFAYAELLLRAAAEGLGVALVPSHLAEGDLATGSLVTPFDFTYDSGFSYWLVCPVHALGDRRVAAFREWLLGEIEGPAMPASPTTIAGLR